MIDRRITKFKLRRGTDDQRKTVVFEEGELVYTTDTNRIYVGTGFTSGGIIVANSITYTVSDFPAKNTPGDLVYREDHKRLYIYKDNIGGSPVARYVGPEADGSSITFNSSNMLTIASGGVNNTHLNYTAVASAGGLGLSADGLFIKYEPTKLTIDGTGRLTVVPGINVSDLDPYGGLTARDLGVAVSTDNQTIVIDTATNTIKVSSISAENIAVSAVRASNLHPDVVVASGGLVRTSSGLSASIDNNTIKMYAGKMGVDPTALGLGALAVPAGTIIHTACKVAPTGYIACSGQRVLGSEYPALSAAIYVGGLENPITSYEYGQIWDAPTGGSRNVAGSYISLPDLRGIFMRGWNFTSETSRTAKDPSRGFGSLQSEEFKSHTHFIPVAQGIAGYGSNGAFEGGTFNPGGATSGSAGGAETRPINLAFLACIKT
jgi:hypothetical protein